MSVRTTGPTLDGLYDRAPRDPAGWLRRLDLQMTIDGEDAPSAERRPVVDPTTETVWAEHPQADLAHLEAAVAAAARAFPAWAATPWAARREALERFADGVTQEADALAFVVTCETGRPLRRAWTDVERAASYVRTLAAVELPDRVLDRVGLRAVLKARPLGVACAIAPWNSPVVLAVAKIANALVAGDTQVLKPSPFTPLSGLLLGRLGRGVLPPGVLNVVTGDADVGAAMARHPGVAKISFTGSTATGKRIAAASAETLKHLTLELGGNDAALVLADADVEAVADAVFATALGNCGHFCAAVKRLYVHDAVYDDVCAALVSRAEVARLGSGFDPASDMGPVQNRPQFDRIWSLHDDAVARGGRALTGGERHTGPGLFIPPTLVEGVGHGVELVDEEQFGPVLPVMRFTDEAEAVRLANDSHYGLGASIWTRDLDRGVALAEGLEVGTAWINQHGAFTADLPMPFAKESGIGMDYAEYGVRAHTRAMLINARLP